MQLDEVYELNKKNVATELEAKQAKLTADQLSLELREKLLGIYITKHTLYIYIYVIYNQAYII